MFQTLQIEDIVTPEGVAMFSAVDAAAALRACGWKLHYKKQEMRSEGGRMEHAWCLFDRFKEAQDLLRRAALPAGPESLLQRVPEHPFLAALYGITTLRWLEHWVSGGAVPAAVKPSAGSRLCTLTAPGSPGDLLPLVWATGETAEAVPVPCERTAAFCAAAIAVGFLPQPRLTGDRVFTLHLSARSLTFPGLTAADLQSPAGKEGLASFAAAVQGCLFWYDCLRREAEERRTTLLMRATRGKGTAIISSEIWDTEDPRFAADRDKIAEHLAGF